MKRTIRKLALKRESIRQLDSLALVRGGFISTISHCCRPWTDDCDPPK